MLKSLPRRGWVLAGLLTASMVMASHFRYGHLTWVPAGTNTVNFTLVGAFRYNGYRGSGAGGRVVVGDIITETIGATRLIFGDGSQTSTLRFKVTAIFPSENWLIGNALEPGSSTKQTITHRYRSAGPWTAGIRSCCRISGLKNASSYRYAVQTIVDLRGGLARNRSPVSSLPPIVNAPVGTTFNFTVPAADPDANTKLRWRFATAAEFGDTRWRPIPNMTIDANTGRVTWRTPATRVGDLYACQFVIEDRDATTNALRTKVGVDFLLRLVQAGQNRAPRFDPPTPCGKSFNLSTGVKFSFRVVASDPDAGDSVTLNAGSLPAGSRTVPTLPRTGNPVSAVFEWTPAPAQRGAFVATFTATDKQGRQTLCSVRMIVGECFLIVGDRPVNVPIGPGDTLRVNPLMTFEVTAYAIPQFTVPNDPRLLGAKLYSQVAMYNPFVFPSDPIQLSNGLETVIGKGGIKYGTTVDIDLWHKHVPAPGGILDWRFKIQRMR